jgi:predicted DCC family thiol-disulfide oxidoreductase YuxK
MDRQGNMRTGVAAFIAIWQELPNWRWLSTVVSLPLVLPLAETAYRLFAEWRFKHLGYDRCEL